MRLRDEFSVRARRVPSQDIKRPIDSRPRRVPSLLACLGLCAALLSTATPSIDIYDGNVRGISLAGARYDGVLSDGKTAMTNTTPGTYGVDFFREVDGEKHNSLASLRFLADKGYRFDRVDFRWEQLQPRLFGPLDTAEVDRVTAYLNALDHVGMKAILDLHNYGHYKTADAPDVSSSHGGWSLGQERLPYSTLVDVWQRIVAQWGAHPAVWGWEIMNEPVDMGDDAQPSPPSVSGELGPTDSRLSKGESAATSGIDHWKLASQEVVTHIRARGDRKAILVAGYDWSRMANFSGINGSPWIIDPLSDPAKLIYVAHHYWDSERSGNYGQQSPESVYGSVAEAIDTVLDEFGDFTTWLDMHGVRGAVTEVGWPHGQYSAEWNAVARAWLDHADAHDVHWWYFATGTTWVDVPFSVYTATGHWSIFGVLERDTGQAPVIEARLHQTMTGPSSPLQP